MKKSFAKKISKKDKEINRLQHDLTQYMIISNKQLQELYLAEDKYNHLKKSHDSLTSEFGKLKRKLKKTGEI